MVLNDSQKDDQHKAIKIMIISNVEINTKSKTFLSELFKDSGIYIDNIELDIVQYWNIHVRVATE